MKTRPPTWDKYEAVLLLEGLLDIKQYGMPRNDVIKCVSGDLRRMAQNRGLEIDDFFRNANGIAFQMKSMESAYCGHTVFKPATKLFSEIASMYRTDHMKYEMLLKEAKGMAAGVKSVESHFMEYLAKQVSPAQLSAFYPCYAEIENFCRKIKILQKPLFETTECDVIRKVQREIEQNKIFRFTHKKQYSKILAAGRHYLTYVCEGHFREEEIALTKESNIELTADTGDAIKTKTKRDQSAAEHQDIPTVRTEQDNYLMQKYPIIFKRIFSALRELSLHGDTEVSIVEIENRINRIARTAIIKEILASASWSKVIGKGYVFSAEVIDHRLASSDVETKPILSDATEVHEREIDADSVDKICTVDFSSPINLVRTKPVRFTYFGEEQECGTSWTELYVHFVATMIEDYPHIFKAGMSFSKNLSNRIELTKKGNSDFMLAPKAVPNSDYVLETNISASDMAVKMRFILNLCGVDYENVVISYKKKQQSTGQTTEKANEDNHRLAHRKAIDQSTFTRYLKSEKMSEATCRNYSSAINTCETFAKEHGFASWRLYTEDTDVARETITLLLKDEDFLAYNAKQHNRFSAALGKFALFVGVELGDITAKSDGIKRIQHVFRNEEYVSVLKKNFKKGFRMESPLEIRKFRRYYSALHGCELKDSDNQISSNIRKMCLLYDGKAFLSDVMLSEDLKKSLLHYIEVSFASGKQAIYFQALYNEFSEAFLDSHIHDADMLKAYLMHLQLKNVYFSRSYISREANVEIDPLSEIRSCLQEHTQPMGYEELFSALPHLPQSKIKFILASNGEFINNGQGQYFHESSVILSDEELEDIATIIDEAIEDKEFIGGNELYDAIKVKYPYIIENNAAYSVYGFRDALKQKLANRFSFKGNIISCAEQELSMADVFANYAKRHDSFTLTELQSLASELATAIYFEAVYENSLRISKEQFVSKEYAQFSVAETDAAIDRICTGSYIPIREVTNFGVLPYAGFPWNSFLLEHYVAEFSRKYRLLHSSYNGTECAGAIVKRGAGLETFDEFIVDFLANSHIELNKTSALQLLSTNGYLARRRYSNIESLIILANAQRSRKDSD